MAQVTETKLPGVGVRHEFSTSYGDRVGVLVHRNGRREMLIYDKADPDACRALLDLDPDDARTLAELLGASQVSEAVSAVQHQIEGLAIDWLVVPADSSVVGTTIGDGQFRTRTGCSIVAVVRGEVTIPAPGPELAFEVGDVAVSVGTQHGLDDLRDLLQR